MPDTISTDVLLERIEGIGQRLTERIDELEADRREDMKEVKGTLTEVVAQTKLTNGRVTALEKAKAFADGVKSVTSKGAAWALGVVAGIIVSGTGTLIAYLLTRG